MIGLKSGRLALKVLQKSKEEVVKKTKEANGGKFCRWLHDTRGHVSNVDTYLW
jgi:hypothetical protein